MTRRPSSLWDYMKPRQPRRQPYNPGTYQPPGYYPPPPRQGISTGTFLLIVVGILLLLFLARYIL